MGSFSVGDWMPFPHALVFRLFYSKRLLWHESSLDFGVSPCEKIADKEQQKIAPPAKGMTNPEQERRRSVSYCMSETMIGEKFSFCKYRHKDVIYPGRIAWAAVSPVWLAPGGSGGVTCLLYIPTL